jgi:hypothetical protein
MSTTLSMHFLTTPIASLDSTDVLLLIDPDVLLLIDLFADSASERSSESSDAPDPSICCDWGALLVSRWHAAGCWFTFSEQIKPALITMHSK